MGEWGGMITAVIAAIASVVVTWVGLRGEPAALKKLRAMNDALEKMTDGSDAERLLERARDAVARGIAQRTLYPTFGFLVLRWISWGFIGLSLGAILAYGLISAGGILDFGWLLTVGVSGSIVGAAASAASGIAQIRGQKEAAKAEREEHLATFTRLQTEAAPARTTETGP